MSGLAGENAADSMYFVTWGDPESDFLCVEPWLGFPNSLNESGGKVRLEPQEAAVWVQEYALSELS